MDIFHQILADLETYPETNVTIEIEDVTFDGEVLNEGEVAFFKIRVTNNGLLNLTDVKLKVEGRNGATVRAGLGQPFTSEFVTEVLPAIDANGGSELVTLPAFTAPGVAQDSKTLVRATLRAWNANLDHIFVDRSSALDVPRGTFAAAVEPL